MMAAVALMTAMSFTACSDDDNDNSSNYQKYQQEVTNMVNKQKKNDKVILQVTTKALYFQRSLRT